MAQQHKIGTTHTSVQTKDGVTSVRYHSTDVVRFDSDKITLDSGGWRTNTTKNRMNQASNQFDLGFRVYQENYHWFVAFDNDFGNAVDFHDEFVIDRR